MEVPDKIYLSVDKNEDWRYAVWSERNLEECKFSELDKHEKYIRKDALLGWAEKELERLYELILDTHKVEDEIATPMEMRYLGQYMQMESVIHKLNEM